MVNFGNDDRIDAKDVSEQNFRNVRKRLGRTKDQSRRQMLSEILAEMKNNREERKDLSQAIADQAKSINESTVNQGNKVIDAVKAADDRVTKGLDDIKNTMDINKLPETVSDCLQKMAVIDSQKLQLRQHRAQLQRDSKEKERAERAQQIVNDRETRKAVEKQKREDAKAVEKQKREDAKAVEAQLLADAKAAEAQRRKNVKAVEAQLRKDAKVGEEKNKKRKWDEASEGTAASSKRLATGEDNVEEPKQTASSTELAPTSGKNDVEEPQEIASPTANDSASSTEPAPISGEDDVEKPQENASSTGLAPTAGAGGDLETPNETASSVGKPWHFGLKYRN